MYRKSVILGVLLIISTFSTLAQRNLRIDFFYFYDEASFARKIQPSDQLTANFYKLITDSNGQDIRNGEHDVKAPNGSFDITIPSSDATKVVVNWNLGNISNAGPAHSITKKSGTYNYTVPKGRSNDNIKMYFVHSQGRMVDEAEYKRIK